VNIYWLAVATTSCRLSATAANSELLERFAVIPSDQAREKNEVDF
jgi:hypothetical protein